MRGFFMRPRCKPGKPPCITWQQKRQQQERLGQQKRQQQERQQQELELERLEQQLLLFCRKQTEQQQR
jgi:hypothetical protein